MYMSHPIDTKKCLRWLTVSLLFHKPSKYATSGSHVNKRPQLTIKHNLIPHGYGPWRFYVDSDDSAH